MRKFNLCTSTIGHFTYKEMLNIAQLSGFYGVELSIGKVHKSLDEICCFHNKIKKDFIENKVKISVLNSYISVDDSRRLILFECAKKMNTNKVRLTLPFANSDKNSIFNKSLITTNFPFYYSEEEPKLLLDRLRKQLSVIEREAKKYSIKVLLELHWGTVMSNFTSAYHLLQDINPEFIGVTFDPANMAIEGTENWEYGLKLIKSYITNIHVKNMSWVKTDRGWKWKWDSFSDGMIDWHEIISTLSLINYTGPIAIEDFMVPQNSINETVAYLINIQNKLKNLL